MSSRGGFSEGEGRIGIVLCTMEQRDKELEGDQINSKKQGCYPKYSGKAAATC